jgi:type IV pilus assembly protein PilA
MNAQIKAQLIKSLANKKSNKGFTLIELLVVVIIIGVLAAVALPNLLGQVGKARETEGKNGVGSINRAEQVYHFERQTFAPAITDMTVNNALGVIVNSRYYTFATSAGDATSVNAISSAKDGIKDGIRLYSGRVEFTASNGNYSNVLCQSDQIASSATAAADAPTGTAAAVPASSASSGSAATTLGCATGYVSLK